MRTELLDLIEKDARALPKFASLPVKHYDLTTAEQQHLIKRGLTFTVNRMDEPHCHLSSLARENELREKVTNKRR